MKSVALAVVMAFISLPAVAQEAGWIGITIGEQADPGAVVRRVERNSPADKAGIKTGDVILEFNKEAVLGVQQLTRLVRETPVGRTVEVKVRRENREETLKVTAERAAFFGPGHLDINVPNFTLTPGNFPRLEVNTGRVQAGVHVQQLGDQLRSYFGVASGDGVLVTSVDSGSAAATAGLKAGDVVVSIDGKNIRTTQDFSREIRVSSKPVLKVIRDKQEREIRF
jgi:serine protease Do